MPIPNLPGALAKVLVGIVTRDRASILLKAVESALAQPFTRVSVIDDGSRDETSSLSNKLPSVEWITWPTSRGHVAARNYWVNQAKEEYFVSLDDDAWFERGDEVGIALAAMKADEKIGAIAFDILSPDRPDHQARSGQERVSSFIGCGHMLRLSAVKEVGGYSEFPGFYGAEEKDLCLRLMDAGYQIVRLNGVHVWHDKTPLAREIPIQHRSGVCNDLVMTVRRTPLWLLGPALLSKLYRHLSFGLSHNLLRPALSGFALFLKKLPEVWSSREPVRASTLRTFMRLRS